MRKYSLARTSSPSCKQFEEGRIKIELLDQSNVDDLTKLAVKHGPFDLVIKTVSDGEHQITSLRTLFPFVKWEDLCG